LLIAKCVHEVGSLETTARGFADANHIITFMAIIDNAACLDPVLSEMAPTAVLNAARDQAD
jgi:hypothetical protein